MVHERRRYHGAKTLNRNGTSVDLGNRAGTMTVIILNKLLQLKCEYNRITKIIIKC